MHIRFDGRIALVTGAAQGIGRAIADGLRDAGAAVHVADRDADGLAAAADALGVTGHVLDLADRDAAHDLVRRIETAHGPIGIVITAAGGVCGQVGGPIEAVEPDAWEALFAANLQSALWLIQAAVPGMRRARSGRIVTISSGAGLRPSLTGLQGYAAAKHALVGLTRQLALELGPSGITVNSVAPGLILSNPSSRRQWDAYGSDGQARILEGIHLRRLGSAQDIAHAAMFLASDQASWLTGQVLSVDGGRA